MKIREYSIQHQHHKMASITTTTEFVPEIWGLIKEYAGIFPNKTNILQFNKLPLDDLIILVENEFFQNIQIPNLYFVFEVEFEWVRGGDNWFCKHTGMKMSKTEQKHDLLKYIKCKYVEEKPENTGQDYKYFWEKLGEMVDLLVERNNSKKRSAAQLRKIKKDNRNTESGIKTELRKLKEERNKIRERMKKDQEKLAKISMKIDQENQKLKNLN